MKLLQLVRRASFRKKATITIIHTYAQHRSLINHEETSLILFLVLLLYIIIIGQWSPTAIIIIIESCIGEWGFA